MEKAHSGTNQSPGGREDCATQLRNRELWDIDRKIPAAKEG